MNDKCEKLYKKYIDKINKLNIQYNQGLSKKDYELYGDETTSCWIENLLYYIRKRERGE